MIPSAPRGAASEHVVIGVYSFDIASSTAILDDQLAEIFAKDAPREAPFDTWIRRVHPDDQASVAAALVDFPAGERPQSAFRIVLDDGTVRHLRALPTDVMRDESGTALGSRGVIVDVTSAREAEERLASMLDSISDGFVVLDQNFHFAFVNQRAQVILDSAAEDLLGRCAWDAFPGMVGTTFDEVYHRVMDSGVSERFEAFYPAPLNIWFEVRAEPVTEGIVVYFQDITDRRALAREHERMLEVERQLRQEAEYVREQLAYEATHDPLTGLANRWQFQRIGRAAIHEARKPVIVMFLDLDRFKLVNDSLGHAVGDALLMKISERLSRQLRQADFLARQGGDEFVVLLRDTGLAEAQAVAERMLSAVAEPVIVAGHHLATTVSIGMAAAGAGATVETLLRDADVALYRAKDEGGNSVAWFDARSHERLLDRIAMESDLRQALTDGHLEVHFQPTFALKGEHMCGAEALVRWPHPLRGPVAPGVFVPLAEETGLIRPLGRYVLEASCRQAAQWKHLPDFTVWVNVSGGELTRGYANSLLDLLAQEELPTRRIGIEVTESVLVNEAVALHELRLLHAAGVPVAIDDFGTGYSSLARLAILPISLLKIDQSFVSNLTTPFGRAVIDVIVHLAGALGVETVAEGVETTQQLELLREAGVDSASGYLLGRPAPAQTPNPQIMPA